MSLEGPCSCAALDVTADLCGVMWPLPRSLSQVLALRGLKDDADPRVSQAAAALRCRIVTALSRWQRQQALKRFGRAQ